jgi:hypothetical protein
VTRRRWIGALGAGMLIVGAACAAPTPSVRPSAASVAPGAPPTPIPSAATPSGTATSSPSAAGSVRPGLGAELDVGTLDRERSRTIDVFASTGNAIVFSAAILPDAGPDSAPDLWRIRPEVGPEPELVWRNPARDHALVSIAGDLDTYAFVDMPTDGTRAWDLWVVPRDGEPVLLDSHPGDEDVPSLVPSVAIYEPAIAWTAFDRGPSGPVSQLLTASAPDWKPRLLAERLAAEAELWLPALAGSRLAYTEVVYTADRSSDERHLYLGSLDGLEGARRLDASGLATMAVLTDDAVLWKEADPGFSMFNWGRMWRYDLATERVAPIDTRPQEYVNYPSGDGRWLTWWGAESNVLGVYDLGHDEPRVIERYPPDGNEYVMRPHAAGDLLAWMYVVQDRTGATAAELRYAWLPGWLEFREEQRGGG